MDHLVLKNLKQGWYPIGNYKEPLPGKYVELNQEEELKRKEINQKLYSLRGENTPEINVCCIAGKNGSGKSSFLDIMFRIINNLSYSFIADLEVNDVTYAKGVDADLHFEVDGVLGYVSNRKDEVKLYWGIGSNGRPKAISREEFGLHVPLHHFFYTICINYSIYSFHVKDYEPSPMEPSKREKGIDGQWLEKMFHKNDGYLMPVTLAPFRDKQGNVDMGRERSLAMQRLTTLILLFYLNDKQFMEGYYPNELYWAYDEKYLERSIIKLNNDRLGLSKRKLEHRISALYQRWENYFEKKGYDCRGLEYGMREVCLRYLAYKTLKICSTYSEYALLYNIKKNKPAERNDAVIEKITTEFDHITVKIHQCLHYVSTGNYKKDATHRDIDKCFGRYKGKVNSYDEMTKLLPPSFFVIDLDMCKERRMMTIKDKIDLETMMPVVYFNLGEHFRLGSMSSGERQFLNSISYALYHIKNLEGVKDGYNRVHYSHVNLVLDEAELYYHPEYQRRYVKMILDTLSWCHFSNDKIKSINIIIVTHSPFILSDMVRNNVLYLEGGEPKQREGETFGANFYDMLYNSFFFEKNAIGEIASETIKNLMQHPEEMTEALKDIIGDPLIRGYLINKAKRNV